MPTTKFPPVQRLPNWFAAGPEVEHALLTTSDGAFNLYFYLCLKANRSTGQISVSYPDLADILGKSRRSITTYFEELRGKGVCRIRPAVNQHQRSEVEICDEFWPYTKAETAAQSSERERFIALIQAFLSKRACVRGIFTAADEKYAADLLVRDVSFEQIQRAIALGCCRKYVSLLNGSNSEPINSLGYFRERSINRILF